MNAPREKDWWEEQKHVKGPCQSPLLNSLAASVCLSHLLCPNSFFCAPNRQRLEEELEVWKDCLRCLDFRELIASGNFIYNATSCAPLQNLYIPFKVSRSFSWPRPLLTLEVLFSPRKMFLVYFMKQ